ncbi:MAG: carboxypeptidase-like regulatory domain-containing protein [Dokdonia donghaensis]|jgi:uncharacterized protein YfaP (DUF2135 family)|nr:carboxypeptidase-like regulatory domain-containing protein [Dokdonia donghaensis]
MRTNVYIIACLLLASLSLNAQTIFRGTVVAAESKTPIENAKIGITNQGVGVTSNAQGAFSYKKYHETLSDTDQLIVSAPGFETIHLNATDVRALLNRSSAIVLEKGSPQETSAITHLKIFWDISEGMQDRDLNKELAFVKQYLAALNEPKVTLEVFNKDIIRTEVWKKWDGDMDRFRESVTQQTYNAPSNYSILSLEGADAVLLLSNGVPNYGKLNADQDIPVVPFTTVQTTEGPQYLAALAKYTSGTVKKAVVQAPVVENVTPTVNRKNRIYSGEITSLTQKISGTIQSLGRPLQGATIVVKGDLKEYTTDANGAFQVEAAAGDILLVQALGMFPKAVAVQEQNNYDIKMLPSSDQLEEVVLTARREKIFAGDKIIEGTNEPNMPGGITSLGDFYITDKDITPDGQSLERVLRKNFKGVQVSYTEKGEVVTIFGKRPNWIVNGVMVRQGQPIPLYIPDKEILSVIIKDNPLSTNIKYGGEGDRGLQVLVTTKSYRKDAIKNTALVTGNDYTEEVEDRSATAEQVTGVITSGAKPLKGAAITKKGTFNEVYTDANGRFTITAAIDDVLVVSAPAMFTKEVLIETQDMGAITLTSKSNDLDEVVLEGRERVDNTVETAYGKTSGDKIGYATGEISTRNYSAGYTSLDQLIKGKVSGVTVNSGLLTGQATTYKIRGGSKSITNDVPPIWIVNGTPYQDPPSFLDVNQIDNISVLKSVVATSRYGSLAAGGAFLIKTKEANFEAKAAKNKQSALVSGNEYTGDVTGSIDTALPSYILRFRESGTPQQQFALYKKLSRTQESPLEYYVDAAQYFQTIDPKLADEVRSDLAYIARNNTKALRTLSYLYELVNDTGNIVLVNERIAKIAPSESQSYRDLALAYQNDAQYDKALELYINMLGEQIMGVNFNGLEKPLRSELSRLVALHKDKIDYSRLPNEWLRTDFKIDMRMTIDWSDKSVPFEFQFVNPQKKFFKWTHTLEESRDRLKAEQKEGFQTEEFIIDDAPAGEWLINVQYLGNEGDYVLPPFLKYTVYRNYGTPKETKEVRVIKLFKQVDKVTLAKVTM